jgi:hypothetical protein
MNDPVIVYLADKRDRFDPVGWYRFDLLCASLKTVKLFLPPLPIVIFHEDFKDADRELIHAIIPNVMFEQVDFSGQEEFHVNTRPDGRVGVYGYCMMCRFFSGVMQSHNLVTSHSHYMRLDDDCYFVAPVSLDALSRSLWADYTYNFKFLEHRKDLYDFTVDFMKKEGLSRKSVPKYTKHHSPYTNFHISSLSLWRNPIVKKYVDLIEEVHGCLSKGWTDSSIQYMIAHLLGPPLRLRVHFDRFLGHRHNLHCCHLGPHTEYCIDNSGNRPSWGPPACLEK